MFQGSENLTGFQKILVGAMSGISRQTVSLPLEIIRTRFQTNKLVYSSNTPMMMYNIVKKEGFFKLYNGYSFSLVGGILGGAFWPIFFIAEDTLTKAYKSTFHKDPNSFAIMVPSVYIGWTLTTLMTCPFMYAKVKLQSTTDRSIIRAMKGSTFRSVYKGYLNLSMTSISLIINFSSYKKMKPFFEKWTHNKTLSSVVSSALSFMVASSVMYPNDRLINLMRVHQKNFDLRTFFRGGNFYKGYSSNLMAGVFGNMVSFFVVENLVNYFKEKKGRESTFFGENENDI